MAQVPASIVHDEIGRIIAIVRPAPGTRAIISGGDGQTVLETEVDEDSVIDLVGGGYRVDATRRLVVAS